MNFLNTMLLSAAETTTETEETIEAIVTEYSNRVIPQLTIVMIIVGAVLMVAAAIAVFMLLRKRGEHYGLGIIYGMLAYMISGYILYMATNWGLTKIWGEDYVSANKNMFTAILAAAAVIYECAGTVIGIKLIFNSSAKRQISLDITTPLMFGWGFFIACLLLSNELLYSFEYATTAMSINKMGFDAAVTTMVQNGVDEQTAVSTILGLCDQDSWAYLFDALTYVLKCAAIMTSAAAVYGVEKERLDGKWIFFSFVPVLFSYIPPVLSSVCGLSTGLALILLFVLIAAAAAVMCWAVKKYMPEEIESLKQIRENRNGRGGGFFGGGRREEEQPKKMPKIVMPKD